MENKKLLLRTPSELVLKNSREICRLALGVKNYDFELLKPFGFKGLAVDRRIVLCNGWTIHPVLMKDKENVAWEAHRLQELEFHGKQGSVFDRHTSIKTDSDLAGQEVILLTLGSDALKVGEGEDFLLMDKGGNPLRTHYAAFDCPNWDPNCQESIALLKKYHAGRFSRKLASKAIERSWGN